MSDAQSVVDRFVSSLKNILAPAHVRSRAAQRRHHEHRDAGAEKISRHESPKPGEQDDGPHGGDGE